MNSKISDVKVPDYVMVIVMIWVSASALLFVNYPAKILLFSVWSLGYVFMKLLAKRQGYAPRSAVGLIALLILLASTILVPLINRDYNLSPYALIAIVLIVAYALNLVLPFPKFATVYVQVMTTLGAISIGFWVLGNLAPGLISRLPIVEGQYSNYADAGVHVFILSRGIGAEGEILSRNSGIAWEPGAYQALLVLALLLLLSRIEWSGLRRGDQARIMVIVAAVLTTMSLTGLFCLLVLMLSYRSVIYAAFRPVPILGALALAFGTWGLVLAWGSIVSANRYAGGPDSVLSRLSLERSDSLELTPWFVFGSSFSTFEATGLPIWNSLLHSVIALGWLFSLLLVFMYWRFALLFRPHTIAIVLVLLACFSTENYIRSLLFAYAAFAGLMQESARSLTADIPSRGSAEFPSADASPETQRPPSPTTTPEPRS